MIDWKKRFDGGYVSADARFRIEKRESTAPGTNVGGRRSGFASVRRRKITAWVLIDHEQRGLGTEFKEQRCISLDSCKRFAENLKK